MLKLNLFKRIEPDQDIDIDPLEYWKVNERVFPRLSTLAKRYLGIPASSVPVERLFSSAGELISKKRNSLLPENANVLLSLHC